MIKAFIHFFCPAFIYIKTLGFIDIDAASEHLIATTIIKTKAIKNGFARNFCN